MVGRHQFCVAPRRGGHGEGGWLLTSTPSSWKALAFSIDVGSAPSRKQPPKKPSPLPPPPCACR
eukprot:7552023-Pyramimonas_sp.AAC.1